MWNWHKFSCQYHWKNEVFLAPSSWRCKVERLFLVSFKRYATLSSTNDSAQRSLNSYNHRKLVNSWWPHSQPFDYSLTQYPFPATQQSSQCPEVSGEGTKLTWKPSHTLYWSTLHLQKASKSLLLSFTKGGTRSRYTKPLKSHWINFHSKWVKEMILNLKYPAVMISSARFMESGKTFS